ncbi:hypothetical protein MKX07_000130 [Trichoderma sp. CBMAI-0711]|nr:hypothetical protein MKX07_000130 [Trichoderma sp. CBMAI-0711]
MGQLLEPSTPVDYCCIGCCKAADFGTHDYCLPCETNPSCTSSYKTKDEEPPKGGGDSQDKGRRN